MPLTAESTISIIGDMPGLLIFLAPKYIEDRNTVKMTAFILMERSFTEKKQFFRIINAPVARTIPTIQGFSPRKAACTYGFISTVFNNSMMSRIMINAGRTTANVAITEPGRPARELPT